VTGAEATGFPAAADSEPADRDTKRHKKVMALGDRFMVVIRRAVYMLIVGPADRRSSPR
jgi:hypothetical protein